MQRCISFCLNLLHFVSLLQDYRGLQNDFEYRLGQTRPQSPLVIVIDALHNLKGQSVKIMCTFWLTTNNFAEN